MSNQRGCKAPCKMKTHQVSVPMISGNNISKPVVNGVRWHDQVHSDVLQKGKEPHENTFPGYDV